MLIQFQNFNRFTVTIYKKKIFFSPCTKICRWLFFQYFTPFCLFFFLYIKKIVIFFQTYTLNDTLILFKVTAFLNEIKQLSRVRHENIIQMYGTGTSLHAKCIIMEFANDGSLYQCKFRYFNFGSVTLFILFKFIKTVLRLNCFLIFFFLNKKEDCFFSHCPSLLFRQTFPYFIDFWHFSYVKWIT